MYSPTQEIDESEWLDSDQISPIPKRAPHIFEDPVVGGAMRDWIEGGNIKEEQEPSEIEDKKRNGIFDWLRFTGPIASFKAATPNRLGRVSVALAAGTTSLASLPKTMFFS